jgi:hypothetical protein
MMVDTPLESNDKLYEFEDKKWVSSKKVGIYP